MDNNIDKRLSIAVIGSGAAGLTAAYLLQQKHDVSLFEVQSELGGHVKTICVPSGPDAGLPIDAGFIVFNDRTYPLFNRLLNRLNVPSANSNMSFSVSCLQPDWEYSSNTPFGLWAQWRNLVRPAFYRMIRDILKFNAVAKHDVQQENITAGTLADYLQYNQLGQEFAQFYLIPMGSAIWSSSQSDMLEFPADTFLRFFWNHGLLDLKNRPQWKTIPGGAVNYVNAIRRNFTGKLFVNQGIKRVIRHPEGVSLNEGGPLYDAVVLATHADQALKMLESPSNHEKKQLGAWQYSHNRAVLHTNYKLMPRRRAAWGSWNFRMNQLTQTEGSLTMTYYMNLLQPLKTKKDYFVSLNPSEGELTDGDILKEVVFEHPLYTAQAIESQSLLAAVNGKNRTFFCGSYMRYGFHEDAVYSAVEVAKRFGVTL